MTDLLYGGCILLFIFCMHWLPVVAQFNSGVNNGAFRRIKLKRISFLFRAPASASSVKKEGIALPMFAVQVLGYLTAIFTIIVDVLLYFLQKSLLFIAQITGVILLVEMLIVTIAISITNWLSH